jgi:Fic family protein
MARFIRKRWLSDLSAPIRRDARGCEYEAYLPDTLARRSILLEGEVAADVADAEAALTKLNVQASSLVDTEALARLLLRAESVASSKIEGLEVGPRRLLRAEAAREFGDEPSDVTAAEILGNIDAMQQGIECIHTGGSISVELTLQIHKWLLRGSHLEDQGGQFRKAQNWVGGGDYNPCGASFVPPPPEEVEELMMDLVEFCNEDSLPAVAQAAIAHAQFETIHPFIDGNGRTGRTLIHLVLRRRGLATRVDPPVSLILATHAKDYIAGLTAMRYRGRSSSRNAHNGINLWVSRFAGACRRAVDDAEQFELRAQAIEQEWRGRLGRVRAHSAADLLLRQLVGAPVITVKSAASLISRSTVQTNDAVNRLVEAEVLKQITVGRRNRAFEASAIVDAFADLERQLASPGGDTRSSRPARPVPRQRTVAR